jgi:hypothetical protein
VAAEGTGRAWQTWEGVVEERWSAAKAAYSSVEELGTSSVVVVVVVLRTAAAEEMPGLVYLAEVGRTSSGTLEARLGVEDNSLDLYPGVKKKPPISSAHRIVFFWAYSAVQLSLVELSNVSIISSDRRLPRVSVRG